MADMPEIQEQLQPAHVSERRASLKSRIISAGALVVALSTTVVACEYSGHNSAQVDPTTTTVELALPSTTAEQASDREKNFREDFTKVFVGFDYQKDIRVGKDVNFAANPPERGSAAFARNTLQSHKNISGFLNNKQDARAQVEHFNVAQALQNRPAELARAMSGEGYVPVQSNVAIDIEGTTYFVNGHAVQMAPGEIRAAAAGDVFWLFVDRSGHIVWPASLRADCGNLKLTKVTPQKPGQPIPPSVEIPPKFDEGILPGDGTNASQDGGTPDNAGNGPADQTPNTDGYLPSEPEPSVPTTVRRTTTTTTQPAVTPTTGTQPTATSTPPTTGEVPPNTGTTPPPPTV